MALKDTWIPKINGVDLNKADDINAVAAAVTELEENGNSIESIEQSVESDLGGGINVLTITLSNGEKKNFSIKNGKNGKDGDDYVITEQDKTDIANEITTVSYISYGKEITESWKDLSKKINAGDFSGISIGDYKTIQIDGTTIHMEVAGINTYEDSCNPEIPNHIDFISREVMNDTVQYNNIPNNNSKNEAIKSPWKVSNVCNYLNTTVWEKLPNDLKPYILNKRALLEERYNANGTSTSDTNYAWYDMGNLWLPTEVEVYGTHHWCEAGFGSAGAGCNVQYPIFRGSLKHVIKRHTQSAADSRSLWWLASIKAGNNTSACCVNGVGHSGNAMVTNSFRVPICFRIGGQPSVPEEVTFTISETENDYGFHGTYTVKNGTKWKDFIDNWTLDNGENWTSGGYGDTSGTIIDFYPLGYTLKDLNNNNVNPNDTIVTGTYHWG